MAKKELSITLRARNALMAGIAGARRTLMQFGRWSIGLGKKMGMAFLGAGAGLGGLVALVSRAYAKQETAERSLASALEAHGDNVDALLPKLKAAAAAIQDQTGVGDEQNLQTMATLRLLGVQADKLEEAARATIALKSAQIEEKTALRGVANAIRGNFMMLREAIPALRQAKTEAEEAAIVNDFLTKGYKQQQDLLLTTGGAWKALKGRVGDVLEEFGKAINSSDAVRRVLDRAGDAAKRFGKKVADFIDSEKFRSIQESVTGILQAIGEGGDSRREVFEAFGEVIRSVFARAATEAVIILKDAAVGIGKAIGRGIVDNAETLSEAAQAAQNPLLFGVGIFKKGFGALVGAATEEPTPTGGKTPSELAQERMDAAISSFIALGKGAYTPPPPKEGAGGKPFRIAGSGGGSVNGGGFVESAMSGYMRSALDRVRDMGHDVEEYGYRSRFDAEQMQERMATAAEENNTLMRRNNELMEETVDLLQDNLSQG